ncbi:PKD domain-containing protein [Flammeovirga pacifica]|uniref:Fibronectin type-III domain-containing protein n=1 Tax=Flammeovirga pacifica TaxID=915059 RepID=A0A1S1Z021_FLAPC|nr:carboxypeptidase regulatory-like domain-containing protein [Flammeovirga pacifica]OHX66601.1 hypothetical protein NH26_09630 [Flammeovirga pacifica]
MKYIYKLKSLILFTVFCVFFHGTGHGQSFDGSGTSEDPYLISTKAQLIELDNAPELWSMHFKLTTDIDMSGETFYPIGYKLAGNDATKTFKGTFDGNFHTISNLTITPHPDQEALGVGFIGFSQGSSVKNLGLINLLNEQKSANIERIGGLIGHSEWGTVMDKCFILGGKVSGSGSIGGLIGMVVNVTLTDCFVDVELDSKWGNNGGIVGNLASIEASASINNAVTYGTVLKGTAGITADENTGNDIVINGLYAISTTGAENPSSKVTVLTPLEMTEASNFSALDFSETGAWRMNTNSYPVLTSFAESAYTNLPSFYNIPITITSDGSTPIDGATVTIDTKNYTTDANGAPEGLIGSGTYTYTVTATGFNTYEGSFTTGDASKTITLISESVATYSATLTVKDNKGNLVSDASVHITNDAMDVDKMLTSDENGSVTLELLLAGTYNYSISKELHKTLESTFTITDSDFSSELIITIINTAPIAVITDGRTIESGEEVTLYGAGSYDNNGDALSYTWTAPEGITLSSPYAAIPTFTTPDVTEATQLSFTLVVNDGELDSSPVTVTFTAKSKIINGLNLIANGGFEDGLSTGWTGLDGYALTDVVDPTSNGSKSVKFETTSKIDGVHTSSDKFIAIEIGKSYKFKGKVKVDKMNATVFNLRFMPSDDWFDAENSKFSITKVGSGWGDVQPEIGSWVNFEKTLTFDTNFKAGAKVGDIIYARLHIQNSSDGSDELIYLDDLMLFEKDIDFELSAGNNQTTLPGGMVNLEGSHNSSDEFDYEWKAPDGITLSSTNMLATSFTVAEDITEATTYTFMLTASLGGVSKTDEVEVVVVPGISVNAGEDQTVNAGTVVTLDGSNTTPLEAELLWTAPNDIMLSDPTAVNPTFTAPVVSQSTTFTFTLTASLGDNSSEDEVDIIVNPSNLPIADAGTDQTVGKNTLIMLDGSGSEIQIDGTLSYSWVAPDGITLSDNTIEMPTFTTPDVDMDTELTFSLIVNDGENSSKADEVTITVINEGVNGFELLTNGGFEEGLTSGWQGIDNGMYSISDEVATDSKGTSSLKVEATSKIDLVETDPDSYFNLEVGKQYMFKGKIKVETMNVEVYNFRFMPSDEWKDSNTTKMGITAPGINWGDYTAVLGEWISFEKIITIDENFHISKEYLKGELIPTRLYIQSPATTEEVFYLDDLSLVEYGIDFKLNAGDDMVIQSGASIELMGDHNSSDEFTYTWSAPNGITLSSLNTKNTTFSSPSGLIEPMEYEFTINAQKGNLSYSDKVMVTVVPEVTASAGDDQIVKTGTLVTLDATATTPNDAAFIWEAPEGITLSDNTSGMPTFTAPDVQTEKIYTFTLRAQYLQGESTDEVSVLVYPELVANAGSNIVAHKNSEVVLNASETIPSQATLKWSAPEGIELSDVTAVYPTFTTENYTEETTLTFTLTATYRDMTSTDEIDVVVKSVEQPVANAGEDQTVNAGDEVTLNGTATTPLEATIEWVAPEGITLSDVNSTSPTFTAPEIGHDKEYTFVLKATVSDMIVVDEVVVTVLSTELQLPTASEDLEKVTVRCYPNPTSNGKTNLEILKDAHITVINLSGQIISQSNYTVGIHELDLNNYPNGIYILQIQSDDQLKSIQLMVK